MFSRTFSLFELNDDGTLTLNANAVLTRATTGSTTAYDGSAISGLSANVPRIKGCRYVGDVAHWQLADGTHLHPIVINAAGQKRLAVIDAWVAATDYQVGDTVIPTGNTNPSGAGGNGWVYKLTTRVGVAAGSEPTWGTTIGGTTTDADGNVWTNDGYARIDGLEFASGESATLSSSLFSDTQGIVLADVRMSSWSTPAGYVLGNASAYPLKPIQSNGGEAFDGTNTAQGPATSLSVMHRLAVEYGDAVMSIAVDGTVAAQTDFDSSWNLASPIPLLSGFEGIIRNLIFGTISDTFDESLTDPDLSQELLLEQVAYSGGSATTRYLSSHGFKSRPSDTPANVYYDQRLSGSPFFERHMDEAFGGRTFISVGGLEVDNSDGALDGWLNDSFNGRRQRLRFGDADWTLPEFGTILTGTAERLEVVDDATLRIVTRDRQIELDIPVQENLIPSGDSANEPVPLCYGTVRNIEPVMTNASTLEFQVHDGAIQNISAVYDEGVAVGFTKSLSSGKFTLNQNLVGRITCDVQGAKPSSWLTKTGDIVRALVTRSVLADHSDLDTASFTSFNDAIPYGIGIYIKDRVNLIDVLDELLSPLAGYYGFNRAGLFEIGLLKAPTGTPVAELGGLETHGDIGVVMDPPPRWRTRIGYAKNWTIQTEVAGSVSAARRSFLANEYRTASSTNIAVRTVHKLASDPDRIDTAIDLLADANTEAARQQTLFGTQRYRYTVNTHMQQYKIKLGNVVRLTDSRFGLSSGVLCRVIGIREEFLDHSATLTLWR